ncbi:hypothetical protein [Listeria aquatica]|uniref:Uncharacterized protein n=1 Tax=Listeria aquatica FSL S10-1188 TaxID=1265818 RepID=W7B609_9LIST|nr:hypothetical protein [Listeria aquatica]EUJ21362.1 hypothetical protein MAQA_01377 [Listeria aquatica FSL S10-1188]
MAEQKKAQIAAAENSKQSEQNKATHKEPAQSTGGDQAASGSNKAPQTGSSNSTSGSNGSTHSKSDATTSASQRGREIGEKNREYGKKLGDPNLSDSERQKNHPRKEKL